MDDSTALFVGIVSGAAFAIGQAAECALLSYSHNKLEKLLDDKEERVTEVSQKLKDFDGHALALAIFNTLTLIPAVCGLAFSGVLPGSVQPGWGLALGLAAFFVLLPVGLVRTVVARAPEHVVLFLLGFICGLNRVLMPLTLPLGALGGFLGRLLGGHERPTEEEDAVEEILDAVSEGEAEGILEQDAADFIENIMESRDRVAREIMTPRPSLLCGKFDIELDEVLEMLGEHGHSRIPIYRDNRDEIMGVLYFKDVLRHLKDLQAGRRKWTDILRDPVFIPETKKINELLKLLQEQKVHIAIVLDEFGGTAGVVTVEDIIEEIVGELHDEFDLEEAPEFAEIGDNTVEVDAKLSIDDLNEKLDIQIPETGDYDTLGGFLASQLGKVPSLGEEVQVDGVHFEVTDADDRKVKRVRLTTQPVEPGSS